MSRIGIMGGTFNPIHVGHLMLAETAGEEFALDEVWFIPTGHSYMKEKRLGAEGKKPLAVERFEMTNLAIQDNPRFQCLDIEVRRGGNTYTYETMEMLKERYPDAEFFFIFGADCLYTIEKWKEPRRIFDACEMIAAVREDFFVDSMQEQIVYLKNQYNARIHFLPFRQLEISSTEIRKRVGEGRSIRYMVPEIIIRYIEEKGFYRE